MNCAMADRFRTLAVALFVAKQIDNLKLARSQDVHKKDLMMRILAYRFYKIYDHWVGENRFGSKIRASISRMSGTV